MQKRLKEEWKKIQDQLRDQIWEHEEIVRLRAKFSELEPKTQQMILAGTVGSCFAILLGLLLFLSYNSYSLKSQLAEMNDEILYIQSANEKMNSLRMKIREQENADPLTRDIDKSAPLATYAEQVAKKSSITKENIEINANNSGKPGESKLDLKLNKISLRQLLRVLFVFENAKNGVNITKLDTDSRSDPEGYLWATIGLQKMPPAGPSNNGATETKKSLFTR